MRSESEENFRPQERELRALNAEQLVQCVEPALVKRQVRFERRELQRHVPDLSLERPQVWSLEHPTLYKATAEVRTENQSLDDETVPFGIREFQFKSESGFWLNGKNFKLKGVCVHHDGGAFGAAAPATGNEGLRSVTGGSQKLQSAVRTRFLPGSFNPEPWMR